MLPGTLYTFAPYNTDVCISDYIKMIRYIRIHAVCANYVDLVTFMKKSSSSVILIVRLTKLPMFSTANVTLISWPGFRVRLSPGFSASCREVVEVVTTGVVYLWTVLLAVSLPWRTTRKPGYTSERATNVYNTCHFILDFGYGFQSCRVYLFVKQNIISHGCHCIKIKHKY